MSLLNELANKYLSDKGTVRGAQHGYTFTYDHYFNDFREDEVRILEIGLNNGGPELGSDRLSRVIDSAPSIRMWHDYFPNGDIWGFDINQIEESLKQDMPRFKFFQGDQGSIKCFQKFKQTVEEQYGTHQIFDIIIDDGSHAFYHQQLAFVSLTDMLKPGGIYVIEDVHWWPDRRPPSKVYGKYVYAYDQLPPTVNTGELFKENPTPNRLEFMRNNRPEIFKKYSESIKEYDFRDTNPTGKCNHSKKFILLQKRAT